VDGLEDYLEGAGFPGELLIDPINPVDQIQPLFRLVLPPLWSGFLFYETTTDKLMEDTGSSLLNFISLTP
jgi:hypothetical protein